MNCRHIVVGLLAGIVAFLALACEPASVSPWPYTTEVTDAGAVDGGATNDAASNGDSGAGMSGSGGIAANYAPSPLRCDGGLCNTDNYSLCSVSRGPAVDTCVMAIPVLLALVGIAVGPRRRRRKMERVS